MSLSKNRNRRSGEDGAALQQRVLAALRESSAYPHPVSETRVIRTHISVIFLAGEFAYKVKRHVQFDFVDLSTLPARLACCEEEVRLNRRLSPELYLGVVPITEGSEGIRIGGLGPPVEYAVQMRRLPEDRMMDALVRAGPFPAGAIAALAARLADFHAQAETGEEISAFGSPSTIGSLWEEHFAQTERLVGSVLEPFQDAFLRATVQAWLVRKNALLRRRVLDGHIRDGHGDLRCSSVCFTEPLQIFDCLEFSRRLRCCDVASDISFLLMDLAWLRRQDLADELVRRYTERSGDGELPQLVPFYGCYRACVRAKVSALSAENLEATASERARLLRDAQGLFSLACRYANEDRPPMLVVVCGLSGVGKSTVSQRLARTLSAPVVSTDIVRKEIHGLQPTERRAGAFGEGLYAPDATRRTYAALAFRAEQLLQAGESVVVDGTFAHAWQRELAATAAKRSGALIFYVELTAPDPLVRERLAARAGDPSATSDADWSLYLAQKAGWEAFQLPEWTHVSVCADGTPQAITSEALAALKRRLN